MKLTGKEIRIILGTIILFLHVPFSRTQKRLLSSSESDELERLFDELFEETEKQAGVSETDDWETKVFKRQSVVIEKAFYVQECLFFIEMLTACVHEARYDTDLNVYFGGDSYGIVIADFQCLLERLKSKCPK